MSSPLVSVLMSVYNSEAYLAEAIESILNQSMTDFEFIIINDGSTDKSTEILRKYASKDPRIILIEQDNIGLTKSLNIGLHNSRGKFIARMDADDISLPDRLYKQTTYLTNNPTVSAVGSYATIIAEFGFKIARWDLFTSHEEIDKYNMKGLGGGIIHPSVMMRKDILKNIGGYDETLLVAQDFDLWLRLAEVSKLANIPEYCILYRRRLDSISVRKIQTQLQTALSIHARACERRGIQCFFQYNIGELLAYHKDKLSIRKNWINDAKYHSYWQGYLVQKILLAFDEMQAGQGFPFIKRLKRLYNK